MTSYHLPPLVRKFFQDLTLCLDPRHCLRLPDLLLGILLAGSRRTVTSWVLAAGLSEDWRRCYGSIEATGHQVRQMAAAALRHVRPCLGSGRLLVAIDDTPTPRYGPEVEGAGIHHNPTPGPAGEKRLYGHNWVVLSALADHPDWGTIALPLQAQLYIRACDIPELPPERARGFQTKLQLAVGQLEWLKPLVTKQFDQLWVAVDGGYAKKNFLRPVREAGWVIVSRLRCDAQLWDLPPTERRPGQRGPMPTYGKGRISLAKRAGQTRGWQEVTCVQYGEEVTKTVKTFLATYRPAGGVIRVVIVREEKDWVAFFSTDPDVTAEQILETAADRGAVEVMNRDVKEVWGAGEQQVRNVYSNEACFNLNLWMHGMVEAWAWGEEFEDLVDRSRRPWDSQSRRPSHSDRRKALRRDILERQIQAALSGPLDPEEVRRLAERLLELAA